MMKLTEQQVWNLMVYGTGTMLLMFFCIIGLVLYFNRKQREWNQELQELMKAKRESLKPKINTEDEYLMISGGRKVKNKNWKGNTLKDSHIMD